MPAKLETTKERELLAHYRIMRDALERIAYWPPNTPNDVTTIDAMRALAYAALTGEKRRAKR